MFDLDVLEHLLHVPLNLMPKELHARKNAHHALLKDASIPSFSACMHATFEKCSSTYNSLSGEEREQFLADTNFSTVLRPLAIAVKTSSWMAVFRI